MKRGQSGLSCVLAVDKPIGASSHDVVNMARRTLGERRIGHAGTLDPFASGVLLLMVGPAARLDNYFVGHDKTYIATIVFGASTTTDDCTGNVVSLKDAPSRLLDRNFAESVLRSFEGESMQMPPIYSAIKSGGKRAYEEARRGNIIKLEPRPIKVFQADLIEIGCMSEELVEQTRETATISARSHEIDSSLFSSYPTSPYWKVRFKVSKGAYIRSLARDIGVKADCLAHLSGLRRISSGNMGLEDCIAASCLEKDWRRGCIDPVCALGFKALFASERQIADVLCGRSFKPFKDQILSISHGRSSCECLPPFMQCDSPIADGENISIIANNELKAIYSFDAMRQTLSPSCVFNIGVSRGFIT